MQNWVWTKDLVRSFSLRENRLSNNSKKQGMKIQMGHIFNGLLTSSATAVVQCFKRSASTFQA